MTIETVLILEGRKLKIFALQVDGKTPVLEFLTELKKTNEKASNHLLSHLQLISDAGNPHNKDIFTKVGSGQHTWELRYDQIRIFCCYNPEQTQLIVLASHMRKDFGKQKQRTPKKIKKEQTQKIKETSELCDQFFLEQEST
ncbi:MAG: type II toxin-antitoxin system RelE/ParE family toxin [Candidatus Electryoneaceae bacterium]|nr:type II toxin-antitoxin system RelE/ParE family toxin [Candidatus Electryoneaceae bacterium]